MKFGDIFFKKTGKNATELSLEEIEKETIKNVKFNKYGKNVVSNRGNIFKNLFYPTNIDASIDYRLA